MQVFIITDIFGITGQLERYSKQLLTSGCRVQVIDPYQGGKQDFPDEQQAYQGFNHKCGFDAYVERIAAILANSEQEKTILGFSVGATAAYKAADKLSHDGQNMTIRHLLGFYPGQIRHHLDICPGCPITLIFPRRERHFALEPVIHRLAEKRHIRCIRTPFEHGFMNPLSVNYHRQAAQHYFQQLTGANLRLTAQALHNKLLPEQMIPA
ncbi:dienelactone hydrolase family protein [Thalassomonas viridans]|uniref:Dienelactone hydrolase family protein n=1 Tax=Thalassomonas viridans TaxID=137584 RepID=A0AAF0CAV5_9GAMM|nr:dienelactone hydrolase family protein [Thalassomonas viridans]WDE06946.1 dienelactone hydrolase family protein [Thalassomonas viridans]